MLICIGDLNFDLITRVSYIVILNGCGITIHILPMVYLLKMNQHWNKCCVDIMYNEYHFCLIFTFQVNEIYKLMSTMVPIWKSLNLDVYNKYLKWALTRLVKLHWNDNLTHAVQIYIYIQVNRFCKGVKIKR